MSAIDLTGFDSKELLSAAFQEAEKRRLRKLFAAPGGLLEFVKYFWDVLEPETPFVTGWAIEAMSLHLEACAAGVVTRLLENVPPGSCKSLLSAVFFPLWVWGPLKRPSARFLSLSYSASLSERDNRRMVDVALSDKFRALYGDEAFTMVKIGELLLTNSKTGSKTAAGVKGAVTGNRADFVILDDPNNIKDSESKIVRDETNRFFREVLSNRLNDLEKSVIIVIQQRSHEDDVSGHILSEKLPYTHLCIPLLYEEGRNIPPTQIGWVDPRTVEGECFWPQRFGPKAVGEALATGAYAFASQYMQSPEPRGGGVFQRVYFNIWDPEDGKYPEFDYIIASLDAAYTAKTENDPSGFVLLGVNYQNNGAPRVFLLNAWRKWLMLRGAKDSDRLAGEPLKDWRNRSGAQWGLLEWLMYSCFRFQVDTLLIEAKGPGITVSQELTRLLTITPLHIQLINPGNADKIARAIRVQHIWSSGCMYRPDRPWAEMVEDEMAAFPKGTYDDLTDAMTQAMWWLRQRGMLNLLAERKFMSERERREALRYRARRTDQPLYPI